MRNDLATKGVTIDLSLTRAAQGIVHGGKDTGWQYSGGRGDIILNVDTQKLGLWPGGFLNVEAEGNFIPADTLRKSINGKTGALMPVNSSQIYPTPAGGNFNLPALNFTQFLSPYFDNRQVRHFDKQWRRVVRKEVCTAMIKGLTPAEVRAIAKEAYVYGNPMVDNYRIQYAYFVDTKTRIQGAIQQAGERGARLHAGGQSDADAELRYAPFPGRLEAPLHVAL